MTNRIALVEIPEQIPHVPASIPIIALSPAVELELDNQGRNYTRIENFFDPLAGERIGLDNYSRMTRLCQHLDELLGRCIPELTVHHIKPAWWSQYWMKILLDVFMIRAYALLRALNRLHPKEIIYFHRAPTETNPVWVNETESVFAVLLDAILPRLEIKADRRVSVANEKRTPPIRQYSFTDKIRDSLRYRWRKISSQLTQRFGDRTEIRVLCLDDRYSLPEIVHELKLKGCQHWHWNAQNTIERNDSIPVMRLEPSGSLSEEDVSRIMSAIQSSNAIRHDLMFDGIDFLEIFKPRFREFVSRIVPQALKYHTNAVRVFNEVRPHVLLTSCIHFMREKAISEAAHACGVPVITSRHGEQFLREYPHHFYSESESAGWILCWGQWEAQWIHRHRTRPAQTPITGSPMIERSVRDAPSRSVIRKRFDFAKTDRIVLFVPTSLSGNWLYMGDRQPNDGDYFKQWQQIVRSLLQLEGWRVVIKEHPNAAGSLLDRWSRTLPERFRLSVAYRRFTECIHLGDAVVLGYPSTTFIQGLMGTAHLYLIDNPICRWEPGVLDYLHNNGIVVCSIGDLKERIQADERDGKFNRPANYREIMTPILNHSSKTNAARRSANAILDIAAGKVPENLWEPNYEDH